MCAVPSCITSALCVARPLACAKWIPRAHSLLGRELYSGQEIVGTITLFELAFCFWPDELQCGVSCGEADHFYIDQSSSFARAEHLQFCDFFPAFGIDNPERARLAERRGQILGAHKLGSSSRAEEDQVRIR